MLNDGLSSAHDRSHVAPPNDAQRTLDCAQRQRPHLDSGAVNGGWPGHSLPFGGTASRHFIQHSRHDRHVELKLA